MADLQEHHGTANINIIAEEEHEIGGSTSRWGDRNCNNHHQEDLQQTTAVHPSTQMNPFLVEMTHCDEDYFNPQEVFIVWQL